MIASGAKKADGNGKTHRGKANTVVFLPGGLFERDVIGDIDINEIADLLGAMTGRPVFDPSVYYFYKIPATVDPWTVSWIVGGALVIAVLASVLPAMRAATMHPVEALRYE